MKIKRLLKRVGFTSALLCVLLLTGCSSRTIGRLFMSNEERNEDAHNNPFFWDDCTLISGYSNLYELTPFSFTGKPYNNVTNFGDNILIIGEGYYGSNSNSTDVQNENDTSNINYYFSVYNPWKNKIIETLYPKDITCSSYQVSGNNLLLIDTPGKTLSVYNDKLKLEHSYDISELISDSTMTFYAADDSDYLYTCDNEGHMLQLDISGAHLEIEQIDVPFYNIAVSGVSPDNENLFLTGVDKNFLKYVSALVSLEDFSTTTVYPGSSFFNGGIGDNALLSAVDHIDGGWSYFDSQSTQNYFLLKDCQNVSLLPNGEILAQQVSDYTSGGKCTTALSLYSSSGDCKSQFQFNLGNYDSSDMLYLSYQGAYLESCNCYFMLLYDANCNPSFLVWDMSKKGTASGALDFYPSEETLKAATTNSSSDEWEATEASDAGTVVNALEDPGNYDWGKLTEVHAKAEELEKKYQIEIYLGPEVPEQIDVFRVKQAKNAQEINRSLDLLDGILGDYPSGFLSQLCYGDLKGMRIYLTGSISGRDENTISDPSGFVNNLNHYVVMVLDIDYCWDWSYTVNHEFSHMIDRRLAFYQSLTSEAVYSEDKWNSYNPDGFEYLNSYKDYENNDGYYDNPSFFIDAYGTTFSTEDRAELFGTAMADYKDGFLDDKSFLTDSPMWLKMNYYSKSIRDGFDTTGWPEVLPWENVLQ